MHKYALPTELELEKLITQTFENSSVADQVKLSVIENRILLEAKKNKEKNLNKIPWWIVLVLAGGFATAAWWAGDFINDRQNTEITNKQSVSSDKISERKNNVNDVESYEYNRQNDETHEDRESPVIYQRESF
jgi:cytoskeletal protein RodZ